MSDTPKIHVMLAGGGDDTVPAKALSYIRRSIDAEAREEPEASSTVVLGRLRLVSRTSASDLAAQFAEHIEVIPLSAPDNTLLHLYGRAVVDVDDAPSTMPGSNSWLVFGIGPSAPRIGVRQTREQLRTAWTEAGLDPAASGI